MIKTDFQTCDREKFTVKSHERTDLALSQIYVCCCQLCAAVAFWAYLPPRSSKFDGFSCVRKQRHRTITLKF